MVPLEYVLSGFEKLHIYKNLRFSGHHFWPIFFKFVVNIPVDNSMDQFVGYLYCIYTRFEGDLGLGSEESLF